MIDGSPSQTLLEALDAYKATSADEARDVDRLRATAAGGDVWSRSTRLHVTGSAIILHPDSGRVLLRWHERMDTWLQVGGHADPGETDPLAIALREGREETGLDDLRPWPDGARPLPVHVVIVPVPAGRGEPEHEDLRYLLVTARPGDAVPESAAARLRWLPIQEALDLVAWDNLRVTLTQVAEHLR
jgi:8-oxo-dGTP pyrophosphatase MutT (NUDIX family)